MDIFIASTNKGKIERFTKLFQHISPDIRVYTPQEMNIDTIEVAEVGKTLAENAELKARAYFGKVSMPIIANDTGFWVDGKGLVDAPKRMALDGQDESTFTQEQLAEKILNFWKGIADEKGGSVDAAWIEAFVLIDIAGKKHVAESKREVLLTNRSVGTPHIQLPVRALYISKATGKRPIDHTAEDELKEMQPLIQALKNLLNEINSQ